MKEIKLYKVIGMIYPASGWEDGFIDCMGSVLVRGIALARRIAKSENFFLRGGYGNKGWFDAPKPIIKAFDPEWDDDEKVLSFYNERTGEEIYE